MTARNSILLIIKQQPGIEYNLLLNKIAVNYGSIESARAALSRSIRYLTALGLVFKRGNSLFATGKGIALLGSEMQNKLLIRLNALTGEKSPELHFDSLVELMQTLIERSKQDKDLLAAARGSVGFYMRDLLAMEAEVEKKIHSLDYLHKIFTRQINSLEELDFPDFQRMEWGPESKRAIKAIAKKLGTKVFTAECLNSQFRQKAAAKFSAKGRQSDLFLETAILPKFLGLIEKNSPPERNIVNLFLGGIKVKIDYPYVIVTGPFKQLHQLLGEK